MEYELKEKNLKENCELELSDKYLEFNKYQKEIENSREELIERWYTPTSD